MVDLRLAAASTDPGVIGGPPEPAEVTSPTGDGGPVNEMSELSESMRDSAPGLSGPEPLASSIRRSTSSSESFPFGL